MRAEEILDSMSYIDPSYIEEASEETIAKDRLKSKANVRKVLFTVVPMAACAVLVVGIIMITNTGKNFAPTASESATSSSQAEYESAAEACEETAYEDEDAVYEAEACEEAVYEDADAVYEAEACEEAADMAAEEASEEAASEETTASEEATTSLGTDAEYDAGTEMNEAKENRAVGKNGSSEAAAKLKTLEAEYADGMLIVSTDDENKPSADGVTYKLYVKTGSEWEELPVNETTNEVSFDNDTFYDNDMYCEIDLSDCELPDGEYKIVIWGKEAEFTISGAN